MVTLPIHGVNKSLLHGDEQTGVLLVAPCLHSMNRVSTDGILYKCRRVR